MCVFRKLLSRWTGPAPPVCRAQAACWAGQLGCVPAAFLGKSGPPFWALGGLARHTCPASRTAETASGGGQRWQLGGTCHLQGVSENPLCLSWSWHMYWEDPFLLEGEAECGFLPGVSSGPRTGHRICVCIVMGIEQRRHLSPTDLSVSRRA